MRHGCQVLYGCFKVRVLPDYGEIVIFLYGIQSVKLENLLDSLEKTSNTVRWREYGTAGAPQRKVSQKMGFRLCLQVRILS
jgi:hypothetical protein